MYLLVAENKIYYLCKLTLVDRVSQIYIKVSLILISSHHRI